MTTARRAGTGRQGAKKPVQPRATLRKTPSTPKKRVRAAHGVSGVSVGVVLKALTEAAFQREVVASLRARGYIVWVFPIMKRTIAGVPDLTFFGPRRPGRLHFWELKSQTGRIRPEQAIALAHLAAVPGVDARIVRPSDWRRLSEEV